MTRPTPLDRLLAAVGAESPGRTEAGIGAFVSGPVAVGWATVDLDRATGELATAFALPIERFVAAAPSILLGARCRIARAVVQGDLDLVLLEPSTEGRLAAALARRAEGPAAIWLAVDHAPAAIVGALRAAGIPASIEAAGPLGPERLLLDRPVHGPHRLVVKRAGTIRT